MRTIHFLSKSGVAWTIWLRIKFLVCVSMTSSCSVNGVTTFFRNLRSKYVFKGADQGLVFHFFICSAAH